MLMLDLSPDQIRFTAWEYKIASISDESFEREINVLGIDGWELVFARRASVGELGGDHSFVYEMIFKRRATWQGRIQQYFQGIAE